MNNPTKILNNSKDIKKEILNVIHTHIDGMMAKTMGPGGANVLIQTPAGSKITKDGISCLMSISPDDPYEESLLNIIKDACLKTNKNVGDGTTGTAVLLAEIIKKATDELIDEERIDSLNGSVHSGVKPIYRNKHTSINKIKFRNGIMLAANAIVEKLKEYSISVGDISTEDGILKLAQVANIATNGDSELSDMIVAIFKECGKTANIKIEMSNTPLSEFKVVDGFQIDKGYISSYFADDDGTLTMANPHIFISEKPINSLPELQPIINFHMSSQAPMIIIAPKFDATVLNSLVMYKMRGLKICCILVTEFGFSTRDVLEDIAVLTRATVISEQTGISFRVSQFSSHPVKEPIAISGSAENVNITDSKTIIIGGCGDPVTIANRIDYLKARQEDEKDSYMKEALQKRIDNLQGGVAIMSVGGNTSARARERFDLAEDAINSCKAAVESGVLPGAGSALAQIKYNKQTKTDILDTISKNSPGGDLSAEYKGAKVLLDACDAVSKVVLKNASNENTADRLRDWLMNEVEPERQEPKFTFKTFDIRNESLDDALMLGIIDPTDVVINEILNAAEGAGTMLSLAAIIATTKDKTDSIANLLTRSAT